MDSTSPKGALCFRALDQLVCRLIGPGLPRLCARPLLRLGVQAECIDLAGQGDACADAGPDGWDIIVDVEQNETGLSLHLESHGVLG